MEKNKVIKTKVDLVKIIDDLFYFFYPQSSTLKVGDDLYSMTLEYRVEGEALDLMIALDEGEEKAFEEFIFMLAEADYQEKQEVFVFRCMARGKWFEYKNQASSLADAERIGWEKLAQDTRHWKYGSAKSWSVSSWSCNKG